MGINDQWRNQRIVVIGMARSGVAVAKLLHHLGANVLVNDSKPREKSPEATQLEELGIRVICGYHPEDLITQEIDMVVKNPGVPYHIAPIQMAIELGIPVVTEVEIAGKLSPAPIIGITGSNGKTTTTTLVGLMLEQGDVPSKVAGNIGQALTEVVQDLTPDEWLVAELSSFQLKGAGDFHPRIAAFLNLVSAHMDYHKTIDDYADSKAKIFQNQTAEDFAVLNWDHAHTRALGESGTIHSQMIWFSAKERLDQGIFVEDDWICYHLPRGELTRLLPVKEVKLPGTFNLENCLAATAIALCAGAKPEGICQVLSTFQGVEHRMEFVRKWNKIKFYNNSKATNAEATKNALNSFTEPIVLIAGGLDRGIDFQELIPFMKDHVRALVAYGQSAAILEERAKEAGIEERVIVAEIEAATDTAAKLAKPGDIVLLSPACASWDLYTSFEERGSIFKQAVHRLV
ncbi:UDP-N-acetylmuramoyl-L-alanine--D-glutamate ligase [Risungbinella massiliensis]|uniref:UDP-N-acetylmuramoyl-L-alanine--D-glutamate ligase n=1 Tax=Risungbinella massiliensis TaxID=1329796 RepID=UPI0005CB9A7A|nr:UDP-N-acetylmuramoyl-L-alanine--D-glutamate ligase [Risungbinella massiliensis]